MGTWLSKLNELEQYPYMETPQKELSQKQSYLLHYGGSLVSYEEQSLWRQTDQSLNQRSIKPQREGWG